MAVAAFQHELAFRTQYAELKERVLAAGPLLPGTPGTLALRSGSGRAHWYRVFYPFPGKQAEEHVCKEDDDAALSAMRERIELAEWVARQVSALRKLGFQVADKRVARVLVELHNRGVFDAGLVVVGTLSYMAWLNELGVAVVSARTHDLDLARFRRLELEQPLALLSLLHATGMRFHPISGLSAKKRPTSAKLPGAQGLRVDVLTAGRELGSAVDLPELSWAGQAVPHYGYLLEAPEEGAILAGGQLVPVRLPNAARWVWHKLYTSTQRRSFREKAAKDRIQALTLVRALADADPDSLRMAIRQAPRALVSSIKPLAESLSAELADDVEASNLVRDCLATRR
jgi:hypothetical protein